MIQSRADVLAIEFNCANTVRVGDVVKISADNAVAVLSSTGADMPVGTVVQHTEGATKCVVATRFRERRSNRIAATALAVGRFVWGLLSKVYGYTADAYATVTTTNAQNYTIVLDTSDKVKLSIGGGASQTFTLTAGTRTAAQVVADFAAGTGFVASETADHKVKFTADDLQNSIEVEAVTNDAYTVLGLTVQEYTQPTVSSPSQGVAGLVIKGTQPLVVSGGVPGPFTIGDGASDAFKVKLTGGESQTFDLDAGSAVTATTLAATINATATVFVASDVNGYLVLTVAISGVGLEIETVANNAYSVLGFDVGENAPPMAVETLEL